MTKIRSRSAARQAYSESDESAFVLCLTLLACEPDLDAFSDDSPSKEITWDLANLSSSSSVLNSSVPPS